ncbi:unnamed protein product [Wickerhamomyces anomalus]
MPIGSTQKSSIDFLLSGPPTDQEKVSIEPKTILKTSSSSKRRQIVRPKNPKFSLKILQQPTHAKVSPRPPSRVFPPFSEHRPIHPPPVLQLRVDDFKFKDDSSFLNDDYLNHLFNENDPRSSERIDELKIIKEMRQCKIPSWSHYSTFFVTARLQTVKGTNEKMLFNNKSEKSVDDLLIGTKVCSGMPISLRTSSPSNSYLKKSLPTEKPKASNYAITFVFSDLSVRKIGTFNLKFDLFEVFQGKIYWRSEILSDEFTVYTPKKFPGSFPSTSLTSFLYKHGARIRQRKRSTPSVRKFEDGTEDQNDDYTDHSNQSNQGQSNSSSSPSLTKSASSTSLSKLPHRKLPKIQENSYSPYTHPLYSSSSQPSSSSNSLPMSDSSSTFTKLPSVEHFHETAFNFTNRGVMNPQQPPQQPQQQHVHGFPTMGFNTTPRPVTTTVSAPLPASSLPIPVPQHIPPPPPGTYVQHIPVTGPLYHPGYPMVQHLPPQGVPYPPPQHLQQQQPPQQQGQGQGQGQAGSPEYYYGK